MESKYFKLHFNININLNIRKKSRYYVPYKAK